MQLVLSVGVVVLWVVLVGVPSTGQAALASRPDPVAQTAPAPVAQTAPDPVAQTAVQQYVNGVADMGDNEDHHGVWLQSAGGVLAHHQGTVPLPAASLTKVATTLAALQAWGPTHQFVSLVDATGPIQDGVLRALTISGPDVAFAREQMHEDLR